MCRIKIYAIHMTAMIGELRNSDIYLDFTRDPSLASALADYNVGETCTLEIEVKIVSKDAKGIAGSIEPGGAIPEGYEREESDEDEGGVTTPPPQPPGSQAVAPVTVAMNLKKKGAK